MTHLFQPAKFFLKWLVIGSLVGAIMAPVAVIFLNLLFYVTNLRIANPYLIFFLPFGGAFISWLYAKFGEQSSRGANLILEEIYNDKENIPIIMGFLVFLGALTTHLFGGSAGREGTGVQMGASFANAIGKFLKLSKNSRKLLLMAGISAGFSSLFGAPLAGTIFAMEVINVGEIEYDGLIPCVIAAFISEIITLNLHVKRSFYTVTDIAEGKFSVEIMLKVIAASIFFSIASITFSYGVRFCKNFYNKMFSNLVLKTFVGGVIIVIFILLVGETKYQGLGTSYIESSFYEVRPIWDPIFKIFFTALTLGAGFQGGELTPLIFTGTTLGSALSQFFDLPVSFLASLGFVSVFAGATNVPLTAFLMGVEMFGGSNLSYLFISCMITYLFSGTRGIYASQRISIEKAEIEEKEEEEEKDKKKG